MAAFRRCILALALLASFATLVSAQNTTPMSCTVTPYSNAMRAEGKNELIGDLVVSCTGGTAFANDTTAPRVDFTLTVPQAITSRLTTTTTTAPFASDALLLIDDPSNITPNPLGAALNGYGVGAPATLCGTLTDTGCAAFSETIAVGSTNYIVMSLTGAGAAVAGAANTYQGLVNGNSVTFKGVPVLPPGSAGARTFRITNVRMNATAAAAGTQSVSLAITNATGNTANTAGLFGAAAAQTVNLGSVATGISTSNSKWTPSVPNSTAGIVGLTNCGALSYDYAGNISFAENFGSAFKTRQLPNSTAPAQESAQNGTALTQTIPGSSLTDSGFEVSGALAGGVSGSAGLADFGTRLKAVFSNIPSGARVYVSFSNVESASASNVGFENAQYLPDGATPSALVGSTPTTSFALLIGGADTVVDGATVALATPSTFGTLTGSVPANSGTGSTGFGVVPLTVSSTGTATAVWEVMNTNPNANETFVFDVFISNAAQGNTGTATVNLSYGPTSATATNIPSFTDSSGSGISSVVLTTCRTLLLFPYVTSAAGFDTGLAVSNTTEDLLGTTAQAGTCSLYVYGVTVSTDTAPTNNGPFSPVDAAGKAFPSTGVPTGQTAVWLLSQSAPGFTGYALAACNFQYAHGFAFVYSPGLSAAMGYLPLNLGNATVRASSPESLFP